MSRAVVATKDFGDDVAYSRVVLRSRGRCVLTHEGQAGRREMDFSPTAA